MTINVYFMREFISAGWKDVEDDLCQKHMKLMKKSVI